MDRALREDRHTNIIACDDSRLAPGILVENDVDVAILDLGMPHVSGEELLATIVEMAPGVPVVIVTAVHDVGTVVRCLKAGAVDYLVKPVEFTRLQSTVRRTVRERGLREENRELRRRLVDPGPKRPEIFVDIVTRCPAMYSIFSYLEAIARSPEPALVVGETGVGKELVAQALHKARRPENSPFVAVNIASFDEHALADALFGHRRGAFTGATRDRAGLVEKASDGSLFLDEIGDLRLEDQTKLLRLIQEHEFLPLGSDQPVRSTARLIAATNHDLRADIRAGRFREDLYYRLHAHLVRLPPLRERRDDVPLLVDHFLAEAAARLDVQKPAIPAALYDYLSDYRFPGNVRELRSMVVDALTQHEKGVLSLRTFIEHIDRYSAEAGGGELPGHVPETGVVFGSQLPTLKAATQLLLQEALRRAHGNQSAAAQLLGISRRTMNRHVASGHSGLTLES